METKAERKHLKYIRFKDRIMIAGMLKDNLTVRDISEMSGYSQNAILFEIDGVKSKDLYNPLYKQLKKKKAQSLRSRVLMQGMARDGVTDSDIARIIQNNRNLVAYEFKRYGSKEHYNAFMAQLTI